MLAEAEAAAVRLRQLVLERHREEAAAAALDRAHDEKLCSVCMERQRGMFLQCGHVYCAECAAPLRTCPACRQRVTRRTKAFL